MPAFLLIPKRAAKQASLSPLAWMFIELLELYWIEDVKGVKSKLRDQKKKKKKSGKAFQLLGSIHSQSAVVPNIEKLIEARLVRYLLPTG